MKRVLGTYKRLGAAVLRWEGVQFAPEEKVDAKPMFPFTIGRHQFYRFEMIPYVPMEERYKIRNFKKLAMSQFNQAYLEQVRAVTLKLLQSHIKTNHLKPLQEVDLSITLRDAELLANSQVVESKSEQAQLNQTLRTLEEEIEDLDTLVVDEFGSINSTLQDNFEKLRAIIDEAQVEVVRITEFFEESEEGELQEHKDTILKANEICIGNRELNRDRWALYHSYFGSFISSDELVKAEEQLTEVKQELEQFKKEHKIDHELKFNEYNAEEFKIIQENFQSLHLRLAELRKTLDQREELLKKREEIYEDLFERLKQQGVKTTSFRTTLLKTLASEIVVKEHRLRYQSEQYERFVKSYSAMPTSSKTTLLRDLYPVRNINNRHLVEASFDFRSPKIEANYDEYGEKTIKPFNAYILYFLLRGDKVARFIGQVLLAAAQYPSQRIKRAYSQAFS